MKLLITFFLMVTIQITFMQKVIASVSPLENDSVSTQHCGMDMHDMDLAHCVTESMDMKNCESDCDMMTVVSVVHFIEDERLVSLVHSQLRYPSVIIPHTDYSPSSLYRPPLFS